MVLCLDYIVYFLMMTWVGEFYIRTASFLLYFPFAFLGKDKHSVSHRKLITFLCSFQMLYLESFRLKWPLKLVFTL